MAGRGGENEEAGRAFLEAGVGTVIALRGALPEAVVNAFCSAFYRALLKEGRPPAAAFDAATAAATPDAVAAGHAGHIVSGASQVCRACACNVAPSCGASVGGCGTSSAASMVGQISRMPMSPLRVSGSCACRVRVCASARV